MTVRRAALLGFGHVAKGGHLPAWRQRDDFQIVALADPAAERRALAHRLIPAARVYEDANTLLAEETVDVVDIATPPALHAPLIARAAAAGCHIICEKPLATSPDDYRGAIEAVRTASVVLYTVHNWKYSPQYARLASLLGEGAIGQLEHLRMETIRSGQSVTVGSEWRTDRALAGGGVLIDHGWHTLYLVLGLAGEQPQHISAKLEQRGCTSADVEDTVTCRIQFPSSTGEIHLTWAGEERRTQWQLRGKEGTLTLEDDRGELRGNGVSCRFGFERSLSAGSHHPDWFGAVIDDFVGEIDDDSRRGQNLAEAESCLMLTTLAYASGAQGGVAMPVPATFPWGNRGASAG